MEKIKYYIEKYKILIVLIIVLIGLISSLLYPLLTKKENSDVIESLDIVENEEDIKEEKEDNVIEKVKVDIKGYVKNPGVYELSLSSRVIDVINMAGGLKANANTEYINLSKKITDEMIIIIYSNSDVEKFKEVEKEIIYIEYECVCPDNKNDACITDQDTVNTNGTKKDDTTTNTDENKTPDKISINTATLEELITLDGIGESKSKAIIEYREKNGGFKTLEELMNVSGIGEAAYSKIKDYIKL